MAEKGKEFLAERLGDVEKKNMTTPTKEEIIKRATELWRMDRMRNGQPLDITPEENELKEEGFLWLAQLELMREPNQNQEYAGQFKDLDKIDSHLTQPAEQPLFITKPFSVDTIELMKTGVFVTGTRQSGKSNLAKLIVQRLILEGVTVFVVDPTAVWLDYGLPVLVVTEPNEKQLISWQQRNTVFDTSQLSPYWQQRFVELFNKAILETAILSMPHTPKTVCVYEEAHTPMPLNRLGSNNYRETQRLLTQGANFNVSFVAITQFSSMIDKLPVKAAQQRYFGKTSEPNDLKYLKAYLGENVKQLPSLPLGQFLYMQSGKLNRIKTVKYERSIVKQNMNLICTYTTGA